MKKFLEGRWFPLAIAITMALAVGMMLFFCGFRITYSPELENSWEAISSIATWVGVVVAAASTTASFLAVWFAIRVPKKIAEQQNKITLFEMRLEIYEICNSFKTFSELLRWAINKENVQLFFLNVFCNVPLNEKNIDNICLTKEVSVLLEKLLKTEFLFDTNVSSYITEIGSCFYQLMSATLCETDLSEVTEKNLALIELMNSEQYQSVMDAIGNDLKLK